MTLFRFVLMWGRQRTGTLTLMSAGNVIQVVRGDVLSWANACRWRDRVVYRWDALGEGEVVAHVA